MLEVLKESQGNSIDMYLDTRSRVIIVDESLLPAHTVYIKMVVFIATDIIADIIKQD